jgi:hypothetical protein
MMVLMLINGCFSRFPYDEKTYPTMAKVKITCYILMRCLFLFKDVVYWYTFPHVNSFIAGFLLFLILLPYYLVWLSEDGGEYNIGNYLRRWVKCTNDY